MPHTEKSRSWSSARDWKSRNRQKRFESSNLSFSAIEKSCKHWVYRTFSYAKTAFDPLFYPLQNQKHTKRGFAASFYYPVIFCIYCSILSALSFFICSVTCPYTSNVKAAVWCPMFSCTVFISSPARIDMTAKVCRKS